MTTINIDRDVPAIFFALLWDLRRKPFTDSVRPAMTEAEWTRWLALADHLGRWYWDLPGVPAMDDISQEIAVDAMTEAVADAISDSVRELAALVEAVRLSAKELRDSAVAVSEPPPDIPVSFPPPAGTQEAAHFITAPPALGPDQLTEPAPIDPLVDTHSPSTASALTSTNGVTPRKKPAGQRPGEIRPGGMVLASAQGSGLGEPGSHAKGIGALSSPMEACEPGCGQSFATGTLGRHRAGCPEWLAYRSAHVHDVTDPNWPKPLPDEDRGGSGVSHEDRASAKAAKVWTERHPGEPARPLTPRMLETLEALRVAKGNGHEAAKALGLANSGGISALIQSLRAEGRLPADIDALIEARKAELAAAKA